MFRRIIAVFVFGCFAVVTVLAGIVWKNRTDAKRLLDAMTRMASQTNSPLELLALQREFGKELESHCYGGDCYYELITSNWRFSHAGLFPCCEIRASIESRNGSLSVFALEFRQQSQIGNAPDFHVQENFSHEPRFSFSLNPHGKSEELWNGDVDFNLAASEQERTSALAFNLNCFVNLKGCRDLAQMAPKIWKVTDNGAIYSRIRSKADGVDDVYAP